MGVDESDRGSGQRIGEQDSSPCAPSVHGDGDTAIARSCASSKGNPAVAGGHKQRRSRESARGSAHGPPVRRRWQFSGPMLSSIDGLVEDIVIAATHGTMAAIYPSNSPSTPIIQHMNFNSSAVTRKCKLSCPGPSAVGGSGDRTDTGARVPAADPAVLAIHPRIAGLPEMRCGAELVPRDATVHCCIETLKADALARFLAVNEPTVKPIYEGDRTPVRVWCRKALPMPGAIDGSKENCATGKRLQPSAP
jgi:hypothetical protein